MKKIFIVTFIALLAFSSKGVSQGSVWNLTYNMSFPTGEFSDFINKGSFRGFGIEGRGFINDNISIGGSWHWSVFNEKTPELAELGEILGESGVGVDVSGVQFRYVNAHPLTANVHYYFGEPYMTRFFLGGGLGTSKINTRVEIGLVAIENNNWHFHLFPEAGVIVPFGTGNTGAFVSLRYNYALKNNSANAFSWLGLNIGFTFIN